MIEGQQITPTLRLLRLLGQGAMGSVWIADHLALKTQVAVKFISPAVAQNEVYVQRFQREAVAAAQVKSPHVTQVFDHGMTSEGVPYIVMELLEGEDLSERIQRIGRMSPRETADIVGQVAKALSRAHQLSIVHRDIKPSNIFLVDLDGELLVKVLDFGVAKLSADLSLGMTSSGTMIGTPLYMSPEQLFSAKHIDARSDLWSLGVAAYFMMTGRVPFHAETLGALSVAIHEGVYLPPSSIQPDITLTIDAWFEKALQRQAANRFGTAREMAESLDRAVGLTRGAALTGPVSFETPSVAPPTVRPSVTSSHAIGDGSVSEPNSQSGKAERTLGGITNTRSSTSGRRTLLVFAISILSGVVLAGGFLGLSRKRPVESLKPEEKRAATTALGLSAGANMNAAPAVVPKIAAVTVTPALSASSPPESAAAAVPPVGAAPLTSSGHVASSATATPLRRSVAPKSSSKATTSTTVKDTIGF